MTIYASVGSLFESFSRYSYIGKYLSLTNTVIETQILINILELCERKPFMYYFLNTCLANLLKNITFANSEFYKNLISTFSFLVWEIFKMFSLCCLQN